MEATIQNKTVSNCFPVHHVSSILERYVLSSNPMISISSSLLSFLWCSNSNNGIFSDSGEVLQPMTLVSLLLHPLISKLLQSEGLFIIRWCFSESKLQPCNSFVMNSRSWADGIHETEICGLTVHWFVKSSLVSLLSKARAFLYCF